LKRRQISANSLATADEALVYSTEAM